MGGLGGERSGGGCDEPNLGHVGLRCVHDPQVAMSKIQGSFGGWKRRLRDHLSKGKQINTYAHSAISTRRGKNKVLFLSKQVA